MSYLPHLRKAFQGGAASYEFENSFEGSGAEGVWTNSGNAPDYDYTGITAGHGSESCQVSGVAAEGFRRATDFSSRDDFYCYFMLYIETWNNFDWNYEISSTGTIRTRVGMRGGSTMRLDVGGSTNDAGGWTTGTWWHVWYEFERNTAGRIYRSSTGTKPGSATMSVGSAPDFQVNRLEFDPDSGSVLVVDRVIVDTTAIGNVS